MTLKKVVVVDNFDSFTYNLVDEFEKRGCKVSVFRNSIDFEEFKRIVDGIKPSLLLVSPGPSTPRKAGISIKAIKHYAGKIPILGICLGHQTIIEAFGGKVGGANEIMHGKSSKVEHDGKSLFRGIENPLMVGRYHSLCGLRIPKEIIVTAKTKKGIVMGVRHKTLAVEGVQFHPESILTPNGGKMIENMLEGLK